MSRRWVKVAAVAAGAGAVAAVLGKVLRGSLSRLATGAAGDLTRVIRREPVGAGEGAADRTGASAREAAILYAYDVVAERASDGGRAVILTIGDVRVCEMGKGAGLVAVPLEISRRGPDRLPRTEMAVLQVTLEKAANTWKVVSHQWETAAD